MNKLLVINAVGLTPSLIGPATPRIKRLVDQGKLARIGPVVPAVTTTVQTTYLTGKWPAEHGIVGNGWYFKDESEVHFWKQSDRLVQSPRIWDIARQRDPAFTCANVCWWYAMYSGADLTVTPRPIYKADGRKIPDCWTHPQSLRDQLQAKLGTFPLFKFWGPATSIESTRWIAEAAIEIDKAHDPTLSLVYLPHLDYCLQRRGPGATENDADLAELDAVIGSLVDHFQSRNGRIILLSEYGITRVTKPVHLNRALRQAGLLSVREEQGLDVLDPGGSAAFAVADHQVAHVYVNDRDRIDDVAAVLHRTPGVARVLADAGKKELHMDHPRSGDFFVLASPDCWFTYYYWLDDARAPDFARTVDIHRKPGYDPVELFVDPAIKNPKAKIGLTLLKRKLGMRSLLDVIPLDATLVQGSHGLPTTDPAESPLLVSDTPGLLDSDLIEPVAVQSILLRHMFD